MATHKSAEKRIRQTEKRTAINRARKSRVRTFVKKVETAIASGDKDAAKFALARGAARIASRGQQGRAPPQHGFA